MFVTEKRIILKTCGTTTLLMALPRLLELAATVGLYVIEDFAFSRRELGRPELQEYPHCSFDDEVAYLRDTLGRTY